MHQVFGSWQMQEAKPGHATSGLEDAYTLIHKLCVKEGRMQACMSVPHKKEKKRQQRAGENDKKAPKFGKWWGFVRGVLATQSLGSRSAADLFPYTGWGPHHTWRCFPARRTHKNRLLHRPASSFLPSAAIHASNSNHKTPGSVCYDEDVWAMWPPSVLPSPHPATHYRHTHRPTPIIYSHWQLHADRDIFFWESFVHFERQEVCRCVCLYHAHVSILELVK